jgi:Uma2 family endonuclease
MDIEVYRKKTANEWQNLILTKPSDKLELTSIGFKMSLKEVYKSVSLSVK